MGKLEKMEWEPRFSVDIEQIDTHQQKMFELFNELIEMKNSKADPKDFINQISAINDYSKMYFSTEERMMKQKKYPDAAIHSKEHRQFTKRFITIRREVAEDIENLTEDIIDELRQWLITHILVTDVRYIPFLRISRFIEEARGNKN